MYVIVTYHCFFFNDTATTEIYTLSLHDALPISSYPDDGVLWLTCPPACLETQRSPVCSSGLATQRRTPAAAVSDSQLRSEEHTSELQSRQYLVCRLLLEKKKTHPRQYMFFIRFH